jgi:long-chain acyl-CoA synthetase
MAAVPLILDRIRKDIEAKVAKKGLFAKLLFNYVIKYKNYWEMRGFRTPLIDYFICENIKSQIGGQLKYMFVGGAPLSPDTHNFLRACLNIRLCQVLYSF